MNHSTYRKCIFCKTEMETKFSGTSCLVTCPNHPFSHAHLQGTETTLQYTFYLHNIQYYLDHAVFQHDFHYLYVNYAEQRSELFQVVKYAVTSGGTHYYDTQHFITLNDADWDLDNLESVMKRIKTIHAFA